MSDRLRNLTEDVQLRVLLPDVTPEQVQKNVPWVMRVDLPKGYQFQEVIEIDQPSMHIFGSIGLPPTKTTGYVFEVPSHEEELGIPLFITSVFGGVDVPWPDKGYGETGDLTCLYLGCTSHSGVPLFHIGLQVCCADAWDERIDLADELQKELEAGYLFIPAKEYDTNKRLQALMQAWSTANEPIRSGSEGSVQRDKPSTQEASQVEESVEPSRSDVGDTSSD